MTKLKLILTTRPLWVLPVVVVIALIAGVTAGVQIPLPPAARGPLVDINDGILIAFIVALGGILAQLYSRVGKLEGDMQKFREQNDTLRADLAAAASFINRVGFWITQGMPADKRPRPPKQLDEHGVDMDPWDDDMAIGGTEA